MAVKIYTQSRGHGQDEVQEFTGASWQEITPRLGKIIEKSTPLLFDHIKMLDIEQTSPSNLQLLQILLYFFQIGHTFDLSQTSSFMKISVG